MTLSAEDRLAIQDLYTRYFWSIDTGDVEAWVSTFAVDGVNEHPTHVVSGHEALRTWVKARFLFRETEPTIGQHWITNLELEGDAPSVRARCYFMRVVTTRETGAVQIGGSGWYRDEIRKLNGRWAFQHRTVFLRQMPWIPQKAPAAS